MERWDRIEVCKRADGNAWVLGEGRFGKVHPLLRSSHFCCQLIHMPVAQFCRLSAVRLQIKLLRAILCAS